MRRGYTFVEILVLIFITCFLSALTIALFLPPGFGGSRQNGYRAVCQSNLKNLALSAILYTQDANEHFPQRVTTNAGREEGWAWRLRPYIKEPAIFDCPLEETQNTFDFGSARHTDYFYNSRLSNFSQSRLEFSAQTILFGEGEAAASDYACTDFSHCTGQNAKDNVVAVPAEARLRHLDGANYAFADGHVKWIKPQRIQQKKIVGQMYGFPVN